MKKALVILLMLCLLCCGAGCRFFVSAPEPETTTEPLPESLTDINGQEVPVFENVERASYDAGKFRLLENGRMGLKFMSHRVFVDLDGKLTCVKNRDGGVGVPPFFSLGEATLLSAARGWPEPKFLDDILDTIGRRSHA